MDCLKDYIGIVGCGAEAPDAQSSGLTVNQLPGINLKSIEKLANAEQENYLGVWNDVQTRALLKFRIALRSRLNTNHSITDKTVIGCLECENKALFSVALWYLLGTEIMIERTSTDRLNRYTTIDLEKAEKLKADFYGEYLTAFDDAISSMDLRNSECIDDCIQCNGDIRFVEAML